MEKAKNLDAIKALFERIKVEGILFVDFRFTDILGNWHHITYNVDALTEKDFSQGLTFNFPFGTKSILLPDLKTATSDIFTNHPTLIVICNKINQNEEGENLNNCRQVLTKVHQYLVDQKIGTEVLLKVNIEFYIFDKNISLPNDNDDQIDVMNDVRSEILVAMKRMGIEPVSHYLGHTNNHGIINIKENLLLGAVDNIQKTKYIITNIASSYGKSVIFSPQKNADGLECGMSLYFSILSAQSSVFYEADKKNNLSDKALFFIGGIIKHLKALNAFTNPTINSYNRFFPQGGRQLANIFQDCLAAIHVPYENVNDKKYIGVMFPDLSANPYLAIGALLMAGIDGIINGIDPYKEMNERESDKDEGRPRVANSLKIALTHLDKDHKFLLQGEVFSQDFVETYIKATQSKIEH